MKQVTFSPNKVKIQKFYKICKERERSGKSVLLYTIIMWKYSFHITDFFKPHLRIHLLILERGEGRERERNIDVREKHLLAASYTLPD